VPSTRVEAYANALLEIARAEGRLADVEDELFRFSTTFADSDDLRVALTDPALPAERRIAVVEELLGGKALQTSVALVSFLVSSPRVGELTEVVDRFVELAAAERRREVAEVRCAVPLDAQQRERLREALNHATGKDIEMKVVVDPTVMGGIVTRIGDVLIDGTVRHRLEQLRETI